MCTSGTRQPHCKLLKIMSFKQVNELRKNGQLPEAYEMAMEDLNQAPNDPWAARALFWTLHDMAHNQLRHGQADEVGVLADRMKQLMPLMGEEEIEDEETKRLPERALERLIRHMQPFYADVKAAYREARTGSTIAPYDYVAQLIANGQLTEPLHERAGWIIWLHLWHQQQRMPSLEARQALSHYLSLTGIEIPSMLHSRIVFIAIRLAKRFSKDFDFAKFLDMWGESNFLPEDWERNQKKKGHPGQYPSIVEQAIAQYIAFKKLSRDMEYSDEFLALLNKAVERYPDRYELKRYLSLALANRGDKERALELHRELAQNIDKFYVWHEIAGLFTHDLDMKTSALCYTLSLRIPENFTCDIHRELGWELAREGNMPAALYELETYRAIRERCGWPKSWRYEQLRKRIPADTVAATNNHQLYIDRSQPIINWVYAETPQQPAIVVARFRDKMGKDVARVALPGSKALFVKPGKLPETKYLMVRVKEEENGRLKLLTADPAERNDIVPAFGDSVTGNIKVLQGQGGKQYGFCEGCFVPGQLLQGVADGDTITILTEMQPDGRRRATAIV